MKTFRDNLIDDLEEKYRSLALLGEGGTAKVWLAVARGPSGFSKLVVLKTIRGEFFNEQAVIEMFLEEARLAARLNHPNIVQTNEVFERGGQPVIVMEYLDGLPFSVILERQREGSALALAMLLRVVSDSLTGLHAAHELQDYDGTPIGVVHRDISPHNLFVTFAGQVKVLDFGIAQLTNQKEITETGVLKGKLRYMAPEQIQGNRKLDRRSDLYSMGVVLWEVAAAARMWEGVAESQVKKRILEGRLPRIQDVAPNVDQSLTAVIERALAFDPMDRYETALEFQAALDDYVSTLGAPLKNSDLGRALSKMFDDVRKERSQTIETQLSRTSGALLPEVSPPALPELTSFSNIRLAKEPSLLPRLRVPALILGALLSLGLFLLGLAWPLTFEGGTKDKDTAQTSSSKGPLLVEKVPEPPAVSPPSPPQTAQVRIRITAFPKRAMISLDGNLLTDNPHVDDYDLDPQEPHTFIISAPGYVAQTHTVVFDADAELEVNLVKKPAKPARADPTSAATHAEPSNQTASKPPAPAEKGKCSPPYFYDERGIKKYRPECL